MLRFRRFLPIATVLALTVAMGVSSEARAGFTIELQSGASSTTLNFANNNAINGTTTVTVGNYNVTVGGSSSAPGVDPGLGLPSITQATVTATVASGTTDTLIVTAKDDTFTNSPVITELTSGLAVSNLANGGSITVQSFLNSTFTSPIELNGPIVSNDSIGNSASVSTGGGPTFTMGNVAVVDLTSAAVGGRASFTVNTTALPEPASLVLALTSLPGLGIGAWLRRRQKA